MNITPQAAISSRNVAEATRKRWAFHLQTYHYLGLRVVGENIGYLMQDGQGGDLACLLFGAAAWQCAVRDQFLGWDAQERSSGLSRLANNTRFLILPKIPTYYDTSPVLGCQ